LKGLVGRRVLTGTATRFPCLSGLALSATIATIHSKLIKIVGSTLAILPQLSFATIRKGCGICNALGY
jgi:hypothetical protein